MKRIKEKELTEEYIKLYLNSINITKGRYFISAIDRGVESKNYLISLKNKNNFKYILKIYSKQNIEEVKYEKEILEKLNFGFKKKYFPVVLKRIFYVNKKPSILLKYIPGRILSTKDISLRLVKEIAKKQAKMHHYFNNFIPKRKRKRFSIFDFSFINLYIKNNANSYQNILQNMVDILKQQSKLFAKINFKKSIIHEDLSTENVIITKNGGINFIDFGESHRAEIVRDIAIAIKEIIINNKGIDLRLIRAYLDSYQKVIRLNKDEISVLSFLLKRRTVFMIAYLLGKQEINSSIDIRRKIAKEIKVLRILQKNNYLIENFIKEYKYE